ncbi:MAG: DUF3261 domain-containing protein [Syntrophotaleaceae bacterium]
MKKLLPIMLLLLLAACAAPARVPIPVIEPAPAGLATEDLASAVWTERPAVMRLRQTARFSFRGREVPMIGMMELDTRSKKTRLVAVNQMGVKLFDLEVTQSGVVEHYLLPQLARYPRFGEAVAVSLRRIFLSPVPIQETDVLETREDGGYRLSGERNADQVAFLFGSDPVRLIEQTLRGPKDDWKVVYLDYCLLAEQPYPREIVLEDRRAGYRLDLRIDSIEHGGNRL